jgi:hypothetical protein
LPESLGTKLDIITLIGKSLEMMIRVMLLRNDVTGLQSWSYCRSDTPRMAFSGYSTPVGINEAISSERLYRFPCGVWLKFHPWRHMQVSDVFQLILLSGRR